MIEMKRLILRPFDCKALKCLPAVYDFKTRLKSKRHRC